MPSASPNSVSVRPHSSGSRYQSALLRARCEKPSRPSVEAPDLPRLSSNHAYKVTVPAARAGALDQRVLSPCGLAIVLLAQGARLGDVDIGEATGMGGPDLGANHRAGPPSVARPAGRRGGSDGPARPGPRLAAAPRTSPGREPRDAGRKESELELSRVVRTLLHGLPPERLGSA